MPQPPNLSGILRYKGLSVRQIEQPCTEMHLIEIARDLTGWENVCSFLGLRQKHEEAILAMHPRNIRKQTEAMLLMWQNEFGMKATYRVLMEAFLKVGKASLVEATCDILMSKDPQPPATPETEESPPVAFSPQALTHPTTAHPSTQQQLQASACPTLQSNTGGALAVQQLLPTVDDSLLTEEDLGDVLDEVMDLTGRWTNMCTALRLRTRAEDTIARQYFHQVDDCLKAALRMWLRQEYNTGKYGLPTWKKLVEAVAKRAGGNDVVLAKEITKKHIKNLPTVMSIQSVATDLHPTGPIGSPQGSHQPQPQPRSSQSQPQGHHSLPHDQRQGHATQASPSQADYQMPQLRSQHPSSGSSGMATHTQSTSPPQDYDARSKSAIYTAAEGTSGITPHSYILHQAQNPADHDRQYITPAGRNLSPDLQPQLHLTEHTCTEPSNEGAACSGQLTDKTATVQYHARVFSKLNVIVSFLAANVSPGTLADELWVAALINQDIRDQASVMGLTNAEKIRPLIRAALSRIKINPANYRKFIAVLRNVEMDDLVTEIESG